MNTDNKRAEAFQAMIEAVCGGGVKIPAREIRLAARVVLTVFPSARDFGSVIGKKAGTFRALEAIYDAASRKAGTAGNFVVERPDERVDGHRPFKRDPSFTSEHATQLLLRVARLIDPHTKAIGIEASSELIAVDVSMRCEDRVKEAFKIVFNAIGKAHGRDLLVDFVDELVFN